MEMEKKPKEMCFLIGPVNFKKKNKNKLPQANDCFFTIFFILESVLRLNLPVFFFLYWTQGKTKRTSCRSRDINEITFKSTTQCLFSGASIFKRSNLLSQKVSINFESQLTISIYPLITCFNDCIHLCISLTRKFDLHLLLRVKEISNIKYVYCSFMPPFRSSILMEVKYDIMIILILRSGDDQFLAKCFQLALLSLCIFTFLYFWIIVFFCIYIFLYFVFRKIGFARAEGHRRPVPNGQFSNPVTVVLEEIQMLAPFLSKF